MRRSLTFKWIVTLLLSSLAGVILVGLFAYRTTLNEYDRLRIEQAVQTFVNEISVFYQENYSWTGLQLALRENDAPPAEDEPHSPSLPSIFALADANGVIVVGAGPYKVGESVPQDQIEQGVPVVVNDERVGTALLALPPPRLDPRELMYIYRTNQALFIGAIGASAVALLIGIALSRQFLRPLSELTGAIAAMRRGDLGQQVQVRSRDELGELATTFNDMSAQIHRANQLRQQMTADIAHDLRTPLMVISGYLEGMRDGTLRPTPERFEVMNQETQLLKRLIEDLRTLSLADAGELTLIREQVPVRDLLEQVRQLFEQLADSQQITLQVAAADDLPNVTIDRERMVQVLGNLVSNALRYTSAGGTITLEARREAQDVQLVVRDTGSGIPAEDLVNIFERFYRADKSRHASEGESGLGLAIAKSIVEAHHGTIAAESRAGEGTSITVMLRQAGV